MDEVLADSNQRFMDWYERDYEKRITKEQLIGKDFREMVPPEHRETVRKYPWTHIVFCGDKSIIHADYLIDDHIEHFLKFTGQGVLFTSPLNIVENWAPRVNNWNEVAKLFL